MTETGITTDSATHEDIDTIAKLADKAKVAILTTVDATGKLVSRPLALQDSPFDGTLWFFTQDPSPKVDDIHKNNNVNVAFESGKGWVSIAGTASVSKDQAKIDELWNTSAEAWFDGGRDDPSVALLRVDADSAEYWASDEPRVVSVFKIAKAAVSGGEPDVGENRTVTL
jgi:general stress protein 26